MSEPVSPEIEDLYVQILKYGASISRVKYNWAIDNRFIDHGLGRCLYKDWATVYPDEESNTTYKVTMAE